MGLEQILRSKQEEGKYGKNYEEPAVYAAAFENQ